MNLIFPTIMVFHFRKKLCKIILDRSRSLYKFLSFILPWYSNRFRWNAPRGFAKLLFPFHQRSFPSRSRSEREVRSFTMIGPSGLYPSLQRKLTQTRTSFVSLIRCSNLSSSVPRCPRGLSSPPHPSLLLRPFSNAYSRTLPSLHRFPSLSFSPSAPPLLARTGHILSQSFLRAQAFFWEPSRSRRCRAIAQMLTQPELTRRRSLHYLADLSGQVRTYVRTSATFAIGNFPPIRRN